MRVIETSPDGSIYSRDITLLFEGEKTIMFLCDPDSMYVLIHDAMQRLANAQNSDSATRRNLAKLMKVGIKGMLLLNGDALLDELFGTKDHPRPKKGDDLLEWYQDIFAKVGLSYLMKNDTIMTGSVLAEDDTHAIIKVVYIGTRPVTNESDEQRKLAAPVSSD